MISERQLQANRANALMSTGPRTAEGKARAAANALWHGLRSEMRILPGMEEVEQWQDHLEQTLEDLAPEGHMECLLAQRIALLLWRLGRAARYEQESAVAAFENAERRLALDVYVEHGGQREDREQREERGQRGQRAERGASPTPLDAAEADVAAAAETVALLDRLRGLPEDEVVPRARKLIEAAREIADVTFERSWCSGRLEDLASTCRRENVLWSAGELIEALGVLAESGGFDFDELYAKLTAWAASALTQAQRQRDELHRTLEQYRRLSLLPEEDELAKITRYEAHLERMLSKAMHELQRRQAKRLDGAAPLPLAVDITGGGPGLDG